MSKSTVQSRGQVTLPKDIREAAAISPGDIVEFEVVGPHRLLIEVIPVKPLQHYWEKFTTDIPYDDDAARNEWHRQAASETMRD